MDVDWTVVRADAVVFDDREIARLIAHLAGGRAVRLKSKPPKRVWIEFSSDGQEVLATHGSEDEARAGRLRGAVIAGPYVLEGA
ncbi:MAG TPA: hypothetical protein VFP90_04850 [Gemmatimonadaceae bacterium]|nr:hypothetical protein [Gemmatimonadaceae bacterium]